MKIIWKIEEGQRRTDNIIWYCHTPEHRYYWIWISTKNTVLFRLSIKLNTEHRSRGIRLTLFNKSIIDYQPDFTPYQNHERSTKNR